MSFTPKAIAIGDTIYQNYNKKTTFNPTFVSESTSNKQ